jgi:hypothetical protein
MIENQLFNALRFYSNSYRLECNIRISTSGKYQYEVWKWLGDSRGWKLVEYSKEHYLSWELAADSAVILLRDIILKNKYDEQHTQNSKETQWRGGLSTKTETAISSSKESKA